MHYLTEEILEGNRRALARAISLVEREDTDKYALLKELYPHASPAYTVGFTGSPGSGKSTLVDKYIRIIREKEQRVAVLAVDPSSPFSGGALLGDRIRMQEHTLDNGVYIRSMGTRGTLGGLSRSTREAVKVLEAFGTDIIILETVGVGQSEVDITRYADTTVLVLTPAGGDSVQTIKAGVMEIADIFLINKADYPGAEKLHMDLESTLDSGINFSWRPPVIKTIGLQGKGLEQMKDALEDHRKYLCETGAIKEVYRQRALKELEEQVNLLLLNRAWDEIQGNVHLEEEIDNLLQRCSDPYTAAQQLVERFIFPENSIKEQEDTHG